MTRTAFPLLMAVLFLTGCTVSNPFQRSDERSEVPSFRCTSFGQGRGIVVDFVKEGFPEEVRENRPFAINLKFANHFADAMVVDLLVQDTTDLDGFPDQGEKRTLTLESALVDQGRWYGPGCRIAEEGGFAELGLGPYVYHGAFFEDRVAFEGTLKYDGVTDVSFVACAFNPALGAGSFCNAHETLSGPSLGLGNDKAPVFVSSLDKTLTGSKDGVVLSLDILLQNNGGGYVDGPVDFSLDGSGFTCDSDRATFGGGHSLELTFAPGKNSIRVQCQEFLTVDRVETHTMSIVLRYPYSYPFRSEFLRVLPARDT